MLENTKDQNEHKETLKLVIRLLRIFELHIRETIRILENLVKGSNDNELDAESLEDFTDIQEIKKRL